MSQELRAYSNDIRLVGDIPFSAITSIEAVEAIRQAAVNGEGVSIRLANAYCVALAANDPAYRTVMNDPIGINFADGVPVAMVMAAQTPRPRSAREYLVRGPSLFSQMIAAEIPAFFMGSTEATLELIKKRLGEQIGQGSILGMYSPPFAPLHETDYAGLADRVRRSGAKILWVGLGTPKQDFVTTELAKRLSIPCIGVGAAFDFYAGTAKEAPRIIRATGLEWIYRLITEPRRLWRRYLFGNATFIRVAMKTLLGHA